MTSNRTTLLWRCAVAAILCSQRLPGLLSDSIGATPFPDRPFVLVSQEELATLRSELAKPGWKADVYRAERGFSIMNSGRGIRANADLWLIRTIEIPARGGHFHQFFCPDGDRLELPKDQRFVPGPYRCPKCGRKFSGERFEGALRRVAHGWLSQAALDLALVSALERRPDYAAKSAGDPLEIRESLPRPAHEHRQRWHDLPIAR